MAAKVNVNVYGIKVTCLKGAMRLLRDNRPVKKKVVVPIVDAWGRTVECEQEVEYHFPGQPQCIAAARRWLRVNGYHEAMFR